MATGKKTTSKTTSTKTTSTKTTSPISAGIEKITGGYKPLETPKDAKGMIGDGGITGTDRNVAKEIEAFKLGYSQEYIASRGGINAQGYWNDVPLYGQLTAAEQKSVALPDGTTNTAAMARILQEKEIAAKVAGGMSLADATRKVTSQWGQYAISMPEAGYDSMGNKTPGGPYNASGDFIGSVINGGSAPSGSAPVSASDGTMLGQPTAAQTASRTAATTAIEDFRANLRLAGLGTLADKIDEYIKQDLTASQIKINLVETDEYKTRFPGMAALAKAGKAMSEAAYISTEKAYDTVLRANGLDTNVFGTTAKYGSYIASQVSPVEFETRVSIAADRVNKNPDVVAALNNYYGVSKTGAISYLLDPNLGLNIVQKEARAAEIGAAAAATNFSFGEGATGAAVAESFINAAGTQDLMSLKTEFGKARNLANTQAALSSIEGEKYSDLNAVTAVLGQDQQKILESQRRAAREAARFSGSSGITVGSLATESSI